MGESWARNPDGSWVEARPLGWQGGHDWELYLNKKPLEAHLYDEDMHVAHVTARTKFGLRRKMRKKMKKLGITKATTF
jgi:hypothetical protein